MIALKVLDYGLGTVSHSYKMQHGLEEALEVPETTRF